MFSESPRKIRREIAKTINTERDMLNCLKPVRLAVDALSITDANLLTGEGNFKFPFSNLEKQNSASSSMLFK
jgi:hypothetical protein